MRTNTRFVFLLPLVVTITLMLFSCDNNSPPSVYVDASIIKNKDKTPIISVYVNNWVIRMPNKTIEPYSIVTLIWADGQIVWSNNQKRGGLPYYTAKLSQQQLDKLIDELTAINISDINRSSAYVAFDFPYLTFSMDLKDNHINMESIHDLYQDGSAIATDGGWTVLNGRTREEVLAQQSERYLTFLDEWDSMRDVIKNYIPKEGVEVKDLHFEQDDLP